MAKKLFPLILLALGAMLSDQTGVAAQESPNFQVVVNMVQLNVAVTDKKGNYITGLRPSDFAIVEDGIVEKTATFAEGDEPTRSFRELADSSTTSPVAADQASHVAAEHA